jgi:hypothetical protein
MTDLSDVRLVRTEGDSWEIMDSVLLRARLNGAQR